MRIIKIKEEHFRAPLSWLICTEEEYLEKVKSIGFDDEYKLGADGHFWYGGGYSVLWVNCNLNKDKFFLTLAHELLHYVIATLYRKGVPISYENDESITYFYEKMLGRCMAINLKKYFK